jgi:hypothetical protein
VLDEMKKRFSSIVCDVQEDEEEKEVVVEKTLNMVWR